jgi:hypothetical protein
MNKYLMIGVSFGAFISNTSYGMNASQSLPYSPDINPKVSKLTRQISKEALPKLSAPELNWEEIHALASQGDIPSIRILSYAYLDMCEVRTIEKNPLSNDSLQRALKWHYRLCRALEETIDSNIIGEVKDFFDVAESHNIRINNHYMEYSTVEKAKTWWDSIKHRARKHHRKNSRNQIHDFLKQKHQDPSAAHTI